MNIEELHIGKIIRDDIKRQGLKINSVAAKAKIDRVMMYQIFKKKSIDTLLLHKISKVMGVNYLKYYYQEFEEEKEKSYRLFIELDMKTFNKLGVERNRLLDLFTI